MTVMHQINHLNKIQIIVPLAKSANSDFLQFKILNINNLLLNTNNKISFIEFYNMISNQVLQKSNKGRPKHTCQHDKQYQSILHLQTQAIKIHDLSNCDVIPTSSLESLFDDDKILEEKKIDPSNKFSQITQKLISQLQNQECIYDPFEIQKYKLPGTFEKNLNDGYYLDQSKCLSISLANILASILAQFYRISFKHFQSANIIFQFIDNNYPNTIFVAPDSINNFKIQLEKFKNHQENIVIRLLCELVQMTLDHVSDQLGKKIENQILINKN